MFYKVCDKCKTKYSYSESCPNGCNSKKKKENDKIYDKTLRKNKEFYHSKAWVKTTNLCKNKFNGLDIYQLYRYKRIVPGILSHHIIEINENSNKKLDISNLIYLSDESHREVHKLYNQSDSSKKELQDYLYKITAKYKEGEGY